MHPDERTLVTVFLRGGADGLALLAPVGDDEYHRLRPRIAVRPGDGVRLDDRFALHPQLAALQPLWRDGRIAAVPATGSDDDTRSHFEAQDAVEHGGTGATGGWLARWLRTRGGGVPAAAAMGAELPESLRGAPGAVALRHLDDLALGDGPIARIAALYGADPLLAQPAEDALAAAMRIGSLREQDYRPVPRAAYPDDDFGTRLRRLAQLLKHGPPLRAACVDLDGWDSHFLQGNVIEPLMRSLAQGLAALATDLGPRLDAVSIIVLSEFGRRTYENSALGTDHGRGGAMFVLGGGVRGGVHGAWPTLAEDALDGPGDVAVANDWRDVVAPVLERHGGGVAEAFPGYVARSLAL